MPAKRSKRSNPDKVQRARIRRALAAGAELAAGRGLEPTFAEAAAMSNPVEADVQMQEPTNDEADKAVNDRTDRALLPITEATANLSLSSVATALVASHEEPNIKVQNMKQHTEKLNIKLQSMKQDTEEINNALKIMKEGNEELANKVKFLNDDDKHLCKLFLVDREKMATTNRELLRVSDQENKWLRSRLTTMENQLADVLRLLKVSQDHVN